MIRFFGGRGDGDVCARIFCEVWLECVVFGFEIFVDYRVQGTEEGGPVGEVGFFELQAGGGGEGYDFFFTEV